MSTAALDAVRRALEQRVGRPADFRGSALVRIGARYPLRWAVYARADGTRLVVVR